MTKMIAVMLLLRSVRAMDDGHGQENEADDSKWYGGTTVVHHGGGGHYGGYGRGGSTVVHHRHGYGYGGYGRGGTTVVHHRTGYGYGGTTMIHHHGNYLQEEAVEPVWSVEDSGEETPADVADMQDPANLVEEESDSGDAVGSSWHGGYGSQGTYGVGRRSRRYGGNSKYGSQHSSRRSRRYGGHGSYGGGHHSHLQEVAEERVGSDEEDGEEAPVGIADIEDKGLLMEEESDGRDDDHSDWYGGYGGIRRYGGRLRYGGYGRYGGVRRYGGYGRYRYR